MKLNRKLVTLLVVITLTINMSMPMVYAPKRRPFDHIIQLIDEDDPTLYGPAVVLTNKLAQVDELAEDLGVDFADKSSTVLSPKDQAKLDRTISKASDAIERFIEKAGLDTPDKSLNVNEIAAITYLNDQLVRIN